MSKFYIILISIILIVCCCTKEKPLLFSNKVIDIVFIPKADIPDSIIKQIDYIPLETTSHNLIGRIDKMILKDGRIYILDGKYSKSIFVFDSIGNYLFKIGKLGKGPGEYRELNDFEIYNKNIVILSFKSVLFYDFNGKFLYKKNFPWIAENIIIKNDKEVFLFQNTFLNKKEFVPYHIIKTNIRFKNASTYLEPLKQEYHDYYRFQRFNNIILLSAPPRFKNTIYNVDNENISSFISFNFAKFEIPEELIKISAINDHLNEYPALLNSFANEELISFTFTYNKFLYLGLHDIKNKITYTGRKIQNIPVSMPYIRYINNKRLFTYCDSYNFNVNYKDYLTNNLSQKLQYNDKMVLNLLTNSSLSENSNPIIICYTLK